jgi:alpha-beta hydrolase superfamily lysophospholipase
MPREVRVATLAPALCRAPQAPNAWVLLGPPAKGCAHWGQAPETLLTELRRAQPDARLYTMDLPGTGNQRQQVSPSRVELLMPLLRERLIQSKQWAAGQRLGLIGSSLGGLVAVEWARQMPNEVAALVLISPAMRPFTPILRATPSSRWAGALAHVMGRGAKPESGRAKASSALAQGLARWRYATSKRRPSASVLLLAGERDEWRDWRIAQRISRAWGAALRLHPRASHDLLADDAAWVARSVAEWLLPIGSDPLP